MYKRQGQGCSGVAGIHATSNAYGHGGSGGTNGCISSGYLGGSGGAYGGGGGGGSYYINSVGGVGGSGAVRIVWPGNTRTFPSTCVGSP